MSKKLWTEVQGKRQFLIPEGIPLEAGSLEIEHSSGDKMMISEKMISSYLATPEELEEHQHQEVEATIADIGTALSSLFQAGKEIFSKAMSDIEESEESEESDDDNVVDVDFEADEDGEEGFFTDIGNIFEESKVEFRSIFDEAKIELKRTLKNKETADFLKSLGHQIVEFANNINTDSEDSHSEDIGSSEEPVEHDSSQEEDSPEPPPAPSKEPSPQTTSNDDSDEIPPSPLPDDNE